MIKPIKEMTKRPLDIDLTSPDGNAFALLGKAKYLADQFDMDIDEILTDMKSGDYEHLIEVFDEYFGEFINLYR